MSHLAVRQVAVRRKLVCGVGEVFPGEARAGGSCYARRRREIPTLQGEAYRLPGWRRSRLAKGKQVIGWGRWAAFGCDDEIWVPDMETESGWMMMDDIYRRS